MCVENGEVYVYRATLEVVGTLNLPELSLIYSMRIVFPEKYVYVQVKTMCANLLLFS